MDRPGRGVYNRSLVLSRRLLSLLICALGAVLGKPAGRARADGQVSIRNTMEVGRRKAVVADPVIFGLGLRGELMWGRARPQAFRVGPAFELRSIDFQTAEGALGGGVLIPMPGDFPIGLSGLLGYATRHKAPDATVAIGTLSWGYRGYNFHHWYGYGLSLFVSARRDLSGTELAEITGGIEIDVLFTTLIPLLAIRNWATGGDPNEP